MSQFKGSKHRVRCVDCTKWVDARCVAKGDKVSPKKKRVCPIYEFKGEYENRTPAEAMYVPHVDKKTRRALKRLAGLGIVPVSADGSVTGLDVRDGFAKVKTLPMPMSTATSDTGSLMLRRSTGEAERLVQPVELPELSDPAVPEDALIWMPPGADDDDDD
jgi:hypothetical protein